MKNPLRVTIAFLGFYASLIALQNGFKAMFQGNSANDGLISNDIIPAWPPSSWLFGLILGPFLL